MQKLSMQSHKKINICLVWNTKCGNDSLINMCLNILKNNIMLNSSVLI